MIIADDMPVVYFVVPACIMDIAEMPALGCGQSKKKADILAGLFVRSLSKTGAKALTAGVSCLI